MTEWAQRVRESPAPDGGGRAGGSDAPITSAAEALVAKLTAIEGELIQTAARNSNDALRHPARLNLRLASLVSILSSADAAPPRQAFEVYEDLARRVRRELDRLQAVVDTDVAAFNALVRQAGLPAVASHQAGPG